MEYFENPYVGQGLAIDAPRPSTDATAVADLLTQCPKHSVTPLHDARTVAEICGIAAVHLKDERTRMGLGSFKALGAAYAIAKDKGAERQTFVAASAGNHGLSVAAGAAVFGAVAVIYLADSVPEGFAEKLRSKGAEVIRAGAIYEESMAAAEQAARENGWTLLSDSTWDGYLGPAMDVMEGYLQLAAEAAVQIPQPPTHIILQAGVGGMAAAVAAYFRQIWGEEPVIIVVEPDAAPALMNSIRSGALVTSSGPVSSMGRLDCKTPSLVGLAALSCDATAFVTITEAEAEQGTRALSEMGYTSTPSGAAGLAAVLTGELALPPEARVLAILSEAHGDA